MKDAQPTTIRLIRYGPETFHETTEPDLVATRRTLGHEMIWLDVVGHADTQLIQQVAGLFSLHPLAVEDAVSHHQRSKTELYPGHLFVTARMLDPGEMDLEQTEQLALFVGEGFVVTFQERPGDCLEAVRERIREGQGRIRSAGADYLGYAILDALIDAYFPLVEAGEVEMEALEDRLLKGQTGEDMMAGLTEMRHRETRLRRLLHGLRDAIHTIARDDTIVRDETRPYVRDAADHLTRMVDQSESDRELAAHLMDYHQSLVNQQMNDVMKLLTVISTVFVPLSFMAGLWGMNFAEMPELRQPWAYPVALAVMVAVAVGILRWFRKRGWL